MRTADGLRLRVETFGQDDAPLTVALAHCWTADLDDWHYQVRALLGSFCHEVRIVTWDHRGHGRSSAAPFATCTIETLARDLGAVLDAYAPDGPLVLAGHSIGGMAMLALPEVRPDLVERCAGALFVATSAGGLGGVTLGLPELGPRLRAQIPRLLAHRARRLSRRRRRSAPLIERAVARRFLFGDTMRLRDQALVVEQIIACPPATMEGFYRDLLRHERAHALAAYDDIPTRVLVGSADLLTPPAHARRIAEGIRGAELSILPAAGHMLPLERDAEVSTHLVELVAAALGGADLRERRADTPA